MNYVLNLNKDDLQVADTESYSVNIIMVSMKYVKYGYSLTEGNKVYIPEMHSLILNELCIKFG